MTKTYALYKGESLLAIGSMQEITNKTNVKLSTIQFYKTPIYKKRNKGNNFRELIELED